MAGNEMPAEAAAVPSTSAPPESDEQKIRELLKLQKNLRKRHKELEEREVNWDDDEGEEMKNRMQERVSQALMKTNLRLAELKAFEIDEDVLDALNSKRPPFIFEGSGHAVLDERISEEITKRMLTEKTNFASVFLTPGQLSKIIRVIRDDEIKKTGKSSLPTKNTDAWVNLLAKIVSTVKGKLTKIRYGDFGSMFEKYLQDEEIEKLHSQNIEEVAVPLSLAKARAQMVNGATAGNLEVDDEDDSLEGVADVDEEEDDDEEETEENESDGDIREAIVMNFLGDLGDGDKNEEKPRTQKSAHPVKRITKTPSEQNPADQKPANDTSDGPRTAEIKEEADDYASLLSGIEDSSDVVHLDDEGDEEDEKEPGELSEKSENVVEIAMEQELSTVNPSPEPPITPSMGDHNDLSPGPLGQPENNENEQKENTVVVVSTESTSAEEEELLKPQWLTGSTAAEFAENFVKCRPVDDDCEVVFETDGIEYEPVEVVQDDFHFQKMDRVRKWVAAMIKADIVTLEEAVKEKISEAPAKRPHVERTEEMEEGELSGSEPKRPRPEEPISNLADDESDIICLN